MFCFEEKVEQFSQTPTASSIGKNLTAKLNCDSRDWNESRIQLQDFAKRWHRGRLTSIASSLGREIPSDASEVDLIFELSKKDSDVQKAALRAVYHTGGLLASSMTLFYRRDWSMKDVAALAAFSGSPCFGRSWDLTPQESDKEAIGMGLKRSACAEGVSNHFHCEYWKEALDGLITGLSDQLFLSRHSSAKSKHESCIDWLYPSRMSPLKYGPLAEDLKLLVNEISLRLEKSKIVLRVWGLSEGILYYQMESAIIGFCGPGKRLFEEDFKKAVLGKFPNTKFFDVTPRAVIGEGEP